MTIERTSFRGIIGGRRKRHKFNAQPTVIDGIHFDSKKEARRFGELKLLERAGHISNLLLQPRFDLTVKGVKLGEYRGDFQYVEHGDLAQVGDRRSRYTVVEDVKGIKTPMYRWKKKHLLAEHGVIIREV